MPGMQKNESRCADRADHPGTDAEEARRGRAGLLRPAGHQQRADRGDQRPARAPARISSRLPQPDERHRQIVARVPRLQTATTPWIVKSRLWGATRISVKSTLARERIGPRSTAKGESGNVTIPIAKGGSKPRADCRPGFREDCTTRAETVRWMGTHTERATGLGCPPQGKIRVRLTYPKF
jgi:hypothetical protein